MEPTDNMEDKHYIKQNWDVESLGMFNTRSKEPQMPDWTQLAGATAKTSFDETNFGQPVLKTA